MNWEHFQTYNDAPTQAFETMCNQLFDLWCKREYADSLVAVTTVNGSGGDGGVESFATLKNGSIIGIQAKWFRNSITDSQMRQIKNSIETAIQVRPNLIKYIVCVPRDLNSIKKGKNNQVTKKNELSRWEELIISIKQLYPSLELILWNETAILLQLQKETAAGIYRYWFEKSEINYDLLEYSFERQKSGWISQKYIPELHLEGIIKDRTIKFIGTKDSRSDIITKLKDSLILCNHIRTSIDDYIDFMIIKNDDKSDIGHFRRFKNDFINIESLINKLVNILENELTKTEIVNPSEFFINTDLLFSLLERNNFSSKRYFHVDEIKKHITSFEQFDFYSIIEDIQFSINHHLFVILGDPGLGKTHGIANLIEVLLKEKFHLPILIRAKDIDPSSNWSEILIKTLGMSSSWSENELWQGLESLSHRMETKAILKNDVSKIKVVPKIVIFIEGLDESRPYEKWIEKLGEIEVISKLYPRVKFCVTSRPYVFNGISYSDNILNNKMYVQSNGDVSVDNLFSRYINHFNINIGNSTWIKWSLKNPLSLRLFCENYENQDVSKIANLETTITSLISKKISIIEKEFLVANKIYLGKNNQIVKRSLLGISDLFLREERIPLQKIEEKITSVNREIKNQYPLINSLIDYFEEYGLIQSYKYYPDSSNIHFFNEPEIIYSIGIQPFFDYIFALKVYESFSEDEELELSKEFINQNNAVVMLASLLMEEYSYLLSDSSSIKQYYNENSLLSLTCFTLSNVSMKAAEKYKDYIFDLMKNDAEHLKKIVNSLIKEVSRIKDHPLGPMMLHDYLMEFDLPADRDIIWSVPSGLVSGIKERWVSRSYVNMDAENYQLKTEDTFDGLPLIYAWLLTTVDNINRAKYRAILTKWAIQSPYQFLKLFELVSKTNDIQMKEDIFSIAASSVLSNQHNKSYVVLISDYLLKNIFMSKNICTTNNIAIRHYSRSILECGFTNGYIDQKTIERSRPPYYSTGDLALNTSALHGTRMGGYGPINYDLSRYVLIDPIDSDFFYPERSHNDTGMNDIEESSSYFTKEEVFEFLKMEHLEEKTKSKLSYILDYHIKKEELWEKYKTDFVFDLIYDDDKRISKIDDDIDLTNILIEETNVEQDLSKNYNSKANELLMYYSKKYKISTLSSEQFILCAAYDYLIKQGWKDEVFSGYYSREKKDNNIIGIDSAIYGKNYPATHGIKSNVMSFCEKYIWCAKNEILGYLSDNLLFGDSDKKPYIIENYTLLTDFPNPLQEISQVNPEDIRISTKIFFPDDLEVENNKTISEEVIKKWIKDAPNPTFEKWISVSEENENGPNDWLSLFGYHSISNQIGGETNMWISSVIIEKDDFTLFKEDLKNKRTYLLNVFNEIAYSRATIENDCYITPKEVILSSWIEEIGNNVKVPTLKDGEFVDYSFIYSATECVAQFIDYGDVYYKIPSKFLRSLLNIVDGDGYEFFNDNKEKVGFYRIAGEKWRDSQSYLCVKKEDILKKLESEQKLLIWMVRVLREATPKTREKYKNLYNRHNDYYMLWLDNGEMKQIKYLSEDD